MIEPAVLPYSEVICDALVEEFKLLTEERGYWFTVIEDDVRRYSDSGIDWDHVPLIVVRILGNRGTLAGDHGERTLSIAVTAWYPPAHPDQDIPTDRLANLLGEDLLRLARRALDQDREMRAEISGFEISSMAAIDESDPTPAATLDLTVIYTEDAVDSTLPL